MVQATDLTGHLTVFRATPSDMAIPWYRRTKCNCLFPFAEMTVREGHRNEGTRRRCRPTLPLFLSIFPARLTWSCWSSCASHPAALCDDKSTEVRRQDYRRHSHQLALTTNTSDSPPDTHSPYSLRTTCDQTKSLGPSQSLMARTKAMTAVAILAIIALSALPSGTDLSYTRSRSGGVSPTYTFIRTEHLQSAIYSIYQHHPVVLDMTLISLTYRACSISSSCSIRSEDIQVHPAQWPRSW